MQHLFPSVSFRKQKDLKILFPSVSCRKHILTDQRSATMKIDIVLHYMIKERLFLVIKFVVNLIVIFLKDPLFIYNINSINGFYTMTFKSQT